MYKIGLIRVISNFDEEFLNSHGRLIESSFSDVEVESRAIENQPNGIHDDETEKLATPKVIELAKKHFPDKDAIIISCAGDPGLEELRKELDVPIIGAGESAALISQIYGNKVGIVGITKDIPKSYKKLLGDNIIGEPLIKGVDNTLDLLKDDGKDKVLKHCLGLREQGAEVLVFACTGLSTIKIAPLIENEIGLPVVDCVYAEGVLSYGVCKKKGFYN